MITPLEQKFTEMVSVFRKQLSAYSEDIQSFISSAESMQSPCQIHIISCKEYDLNLIIKTHDPEFGDLVKETVISSDKFDVDITNFLEQPIWKKLEEKSSTNNQDYKFLLGQLVVFGSKIRDRNFDKQSTVTSFIGDGNISTWELSCDITDFDLNEKARNFANWGINAFERYTEYQKNPEPIIVPSEIQPRGFGAYFYPFILIDEFKPTFTGQFTGSDFSKFDEYVYDANFANMRLVVTRIGLVGIDTDNPELANKIINTIFGTALLLGLPVHANRRNELAGVSLKDNSAFVHSWEVSTLRTIMYYYTTRFARLHLSKKPVPLENIRDIIKTAERVWIEDKFITELELFLQSQTHFDNLEFLQSFNTSWLVIERYLRRKFNNKMNTQTGGIKKHLEKLDISRIMDILRTDGDITDDEFKMYESLRDLRNGVFHGKNHPDMDETKSCLKIAMYIAEKETRISKKFDFNSTDYIDI
jgi:hypothetical protein